MRKAPPLALMFVLFGHSGCRESSPPVVPPAPATTAPTAAPSAPAIASTQTPSLGAISTYTQQQTIEPPPELVGFVPPALPAKVVERQRGRGMLLLRLAPTQRRASLVLLTLEPVDALRRALATHLATRGFTPAPGAPDTFVHTNGERLAVVITPDPLTPTRVELTLDGPEAPTLPASPTLAPEIAPDPTKLSVVGFEEGLLHAIAPGNRDTEVSRTVYLLRAKTPADRTAALATWTRAVEKAGFRARAGRPELWERPATKELLVIRPTDDPSGDVLVSHQRRWRR
jgi:hypothetical protein